MTISRMADSGPCRLILSLEMTIDQPGFGGVSFSANSASKYVKFPFLIFLGTK